MELNGLIQKVMDQMDERRYGKKVITRYRSSFQLLISVSHDIGEDILSERLMKAFLDRPVSCGEKWAKGTGSPETLPQAAPVAYAERKRRLEKTGHWWHIRKDYG